MQIGRYKLKNNLIVAPMAGVTDRPFRMLCKRMGAGMAVSEMVASNSLLYGSGKNKRRAKQEGRGLSHLGADRWCRSRDAGTGGTLQRGQRCADHRYQHGLSGQEDMQCDGGFR